MKIYFCHRDHIVKDKQCLMYSFHFKQPLNFCVSGEVAPRGASGKSLRLLIDKVSQQSYPPLLHILMN